MRDEQRRLLPLPQSLPKKRSQSGQSLFSVSPLNMGMSHAGEQCVCKVPPPFQSQALGEMSSSMCLDLMQFPRIPLVSKQAQHWLRPVLRRVWNSSEEKKAGHRSAAVPIISDEVYLGLLKEHIM